MNISNKMIFSRSRDIVARDIAGELILIPISGGVGDVQNDIYALNDTGREIWERIDGKKSVHDLVIELTLVYEGPEDVIRQDVVGLLTEIGKRGFIVEVENK